MGTGKKLVVGGVIVAVASWAFAQRRAPEVVDRIDGEPLYRLLPVGGIPAIDEPEFVTGAAADAQMRSDEPVLGIVVGDTARAYSLWHLDAHEIVNDTIEGTAIAATW